MVLITHKLTILRIQNTSEDHIGSIQLITMFKQNKLDFTTEQSVTQFTNFYYHQTRHRKSPTHPFERGVRDETIPSYGPNHKTTGLGWIVYFIVIIIRLSPQLLPTSIYSDKRDQEAPPKRQSDRQKADRNRGTDASKYEQIVGHYIGNYYD